MSEKKLDSSQELSFSELKEIATILKSAPDLRAFSIKFKNLELAIESGLKEARDSAPPMSIRDQESRVPSSDQPAIETHPTPAAPSPSATQTSHTAVSSPLSTKPDTVVLEPDHFIVRSPMVGTYYKASQPGAEPFVLVGDKVKKGDVICLIEVMKLINSVVAEVDGTIVKIHVEDAEAVEYGQVLISIKQNPVQ